MDDSSTTTTPLDDLKVAIPCRSQQIEQLYNLYCCQGEPFPDCIYIHGGPSSGKSLVVKTLMKTVGVNHAVVDLTECYTPRIFYESILVRLSGMDSPRCDNMMDFVNFLQMNAERVGQGSVLVIDKAEKLRTMDHNLLPAMCRLRELTGLPLSVIFVSEVVLQKFYSKAHIVELLKIHFPQYTKEELLEILCLDYSYSRAIMSDNSSSEEEKFDFDLNFYRNYLSVLLSVFYRVCRDLSELRYIARKNFVKYCEPILKKENGVSDSMALWRKITPTLKQSLQTLYLRVNNNSQQITAQEMDSLAKSLELPFYAKYLLIAAYLASYNPAKEDKRIFVKYHGKKKKTVTDMKKKSKTSEQLNTQLGPKPFSFDRLLAIFYSILDDKVGFNNNLLVQVSSLVELQLLSCLSDASSLDSPNYKCNVNMDYIQTICKMVGFNVRKYLSDFSHI